MVRDMQKSPQDKTFILKQNGSCSGDKISILFCYVNEWCVGKKEEQNHKVTAPKKNASLITVFKAPTVLQHIIII